MHPVWSNNPAWRRKANDESKAETDAFDDPWKTREPRDSAIDSLDRHTKPVPPIAPAPGSPKKLYGRASITPRIHPVLLALYIDGEIDQNDGRNDHDIASSAFDFGPLYILDPYHEIWLLTGGHIRNGINGECFVIGRSAAEKRPNHAGQEEDEGEYGEEGVDPARLYPKAIGSIACLEYIGFNRPKAAQLARRFITDAYMEQIQVFEQHPSYTAATQRDQCLWLRRRWWWQLRQDALDVLDGCETPDICGRHVGTDMGSFIHPRALEALMEGLHLSTHLRGRLRALRQARSLFARNRSVKDWVRTSMETAISELENIALHSWNAGIALREREASKITKWRVQRTEMMKNSAGMDEIKTDIMKYKTIDEIKTEIEKHKAMAEGYEVMAQGYEAIAAQREHYGGRGAEEGMRYTEHQEDQEKYFKSLCQDLDHMMRRAEQAEERWHTLKQISQDPIDYSPSSGSRRNQESALGGNGDHACGSRREDSLPFPLPLGSPERYPQTLGGMRLDARPDSATQEQDLMFETSPPELVGSDGCGCSKDNHSGGTRNELPAEGRGMGRQSGEDQGGNGPPPGSPPKKRKLA